VVADAPLAESVAALGAFKEDAIPLSDIAENIAAAQRILAEAGWK
jgi:iron(III) transport system substrate-binding protein